MSQTRDKLCSVGHTYLTQKRWNRGALDADQEPSLSRIVACIDTPYLRVLRPVDRREMMGRVVLAFSTNGDFCTPSDCNNTILIWFTHDISGMLLHVCRQILI